MTTEQIAKKHLEQYLKETGKRGDFKRNGNTYSKKLSKARFDHEGTMYIVYDRRGFAEITYGIGYQAVEKTKEYNGRSTHWLFYFIVPEQYEDFKTIMDILLKQTPVLEVIEK